MDLRDHLFAKAGATLGLGATVGGNIDVDVPKLPYLIGGQEVRPRSGGEAQRRRRRRETAAGPRGAERARRQI